MSHANRVAVVKEHLALFAAELRALKGGDPAVSSQEFPKLHDRIKPFIGAAFGEAERTAYVSSGPDLEQRALYLERLAAGAKEKPPKPPEEKFLVDGFEPPPLPVHPAPNRAPAHKR